MYDFLDILKQREQFHQCSDESGIREYLNGEEMAVAYIGYDLTAPSLHVGHLANIMMLRRFQEFGDVIVLLGGATTLIGDPSFKNESHHYKDGLPFTSFLEDDWILL